MNGASTPSSPREGYWFGQAVFPTQRNRFTGTAGLGRAIADLTLNEDGGKMVLSILWLVNDPVYEIQFRWDEVESVARVRWFWFSTGVRFKLRREVVEGNRRRSFYFFTLGSVSRILEFAGESGVQVAATAERFLFLWPD